VRSDRFVGVAIDITSTTIESTVVDATGEDRPVAVRHLVSGEKRTAASDVTHAIEAACAAAGVQLAAVSFACIGVQAAVAHRTDELSFTDTLPGWPTAGIRRHLEAETGVAITLDNDANLAAVSERAAGSAEGVDGFALLWLGEGLGLAIDVGGQVYRGASGGAGEIGYLTVPTEAARLDPAADDLTGLFGAGAWRSLQSALGEEALAALATRVALGLIPVLAILDPERIILGGPIGLEGGARLAQLVSVQLAETTQWNPDVRSTAVAENPVLRGAREVLLTRVRRRLFEDVALIVA